MGLSSSMWTSVSGLLGHGEKMNVVGNNIANVSTIGFKSQRMDFEDFIYQDGFSGGGSTQIGFGVGINTIVTDFSQGAFETTNIATDMAIGGTGYFKVVSQATGADYYTRAGNFNFNDAGFLTLPSGEVLQGWMVDNNTNPLPATGVNPVISEYTGIQTIGEATDIKLDTWTIAPKATTKVEFSVNLTAEDNQDNSVSVTNPLFAMSDTWDGQNAIQNPGDPALPHDAFEWSVPVKVYDEGGKEHTLTAYFDQVPTEGVDSLGNPTEVIDGLPTGYSVYEYLLTMKPEEDARTFGGTYDPTTGVLSGASSFQDTEAAGILMKGTMIFNSSGELVSQTSYTYMGNTDFAPGETITPNEVISTTTVDDILAQPAADRATYIAGLTLDPDDAANDAALKALLTDSLTAADNNADSIATAAATKAAESAANRAGIANAAANETTIQTNADAAVLAIAGPAATAAADAAHPGMGPGDADWDAAYNATYGPLEAELYPLEYQKAYDVFYQVGYTSILPAPETGAFYDAQYDASYIPTRDALQADAIRNSASDLNASQIGHPDSALSWQPTEVSADGYPLFTANFSGHPMANAVGQEKSPTDTTKSKEADDIWMEFDLGLQSSNPQVPWQYQGHALARTSSDIDPITGEMILPQTASIQDTFAIINPTTGDVASPASYDALGLFIPNEGDTGSSTSRGTSSSTNFSTQNGYTSGTLSNVRIDSEGVLYGIYNNNVEMPLYQIAMYDFVNPQGLYREGGNLYTTTRESGSIQQAKAGEAGMGSINAYNIEQSNVDMSTEFVRMISTQRGFQANSKGITTVDEMLNTVIGMKR